MPLVESAMRLAAWQPADLEALAVTDGPGSFTGLRIGVATVKGMARALRIPVAAVSTLHVLAVGCGIFDGLIVPAMDARREQVYTATFAGGQHLERLTPDRASVSMRWSTSFRAAINRCFSPGTASSLTGRRSRPHWETGPISRPRRSGCSGQRWQGCWARR